MSILDTFIVYRFIRLLITPWDETQAFKLGVIDASGHLIKHTTPLTSAQQDAYSLFTRLVFNIKRLIEKIPGGKSKIGTYAAALFLLREELGDEEGIIVFERSFLKYLKENDALEPDFLKEQYLEETLLPQGNYKLINSILDIKGDHVQKDTVIVAKTNVKPLARILGVDVYQLQIAKTGKSVVVSLEDIEEV